MVTIIARFVLDRSGWNWELALVISTLDKPGWFSSGSGSPSIVIPCIPCTAHDCWRDVIAHMHIRSLTPVPACLSPQDLETYLKDYYSRILKKLKAAGVSQDRSNFYV